MQLVDIYLPQRQVQHLYENSVTMMVKLGPVLPVSSPLCQGTPHISVGGREEDKAEWKRLTIIGAYLKWKLVFL